MSRLLLTIFCLLPFCGGAHASAALQESVRMYVLREAAAAAGGTQSRIEVVVGSVDPRLQLAPCPRTEVFQPPASRFWGRSTAGVRCIAGASWSITLPVTVRIYGPALVATRSLAAGSTVQPDDVRGAEVEWTREAQGVVATPEQLAERVLARPVASGQPIPLAALRAPQAVGQGEPVRLVGQGPGFAISTDGIALSGAVAGQNVRVRTESGRIVTGIARTGRTVEVSF